MPQSSDAPAGQDVSKLADLAAALGEHVVDLDRRVSALENQAAAPKAIAASDLRRIAKDLMSLSLMLRRRLRQEGR